MQQRCRSDTSTNGTHEGQPPSAFQNAFKACMSNVAVAAEHHLFTHTLG